jgi:hypothetical protein
MEGHQSGKLRDMQKYRSSFELKNYIRDNSLYSSEKYYSNKDNINSLVYHTYLDQTPIINMKFSRVLFFASLALAAPTALVEKDEPALLLDERQNDPVSAVITALNSVTNTINTSGGAIRKKVSNRTKTFRY